MDQQKIMLMDYLKRCKLTAANKPMVYDPVWALNANCYGTVSKLMLDLAKLPPEMRETHLASIRNFDNDYGTLFASALQLLEKRGLLCSAV